MMVFADEPPPFSQKITRGTQNYKIKNTKTQLNSIHNTLAPFVRDAARS
jgi:hypothetical protein